MYDTYGVEMHRHLISTVRILEPELSVLLLAVVDVIVVDDVVVVVVDDVVVVVVVDVVVVVELQRTHVGQQRDVLLLAQFCRLRIVPMRRATMTTTWLLGGHIGEVHHNVPFASWHSHRERASYERQFWKPCASFQS